MADSLRSDQYRLIIHALREARLRAGVEQAELSERLGKAPNYISRIETAERRLGLLDLIGIAQGLGIEPTLLFDEITRDVRIQIE